VAGAGTADRLRGKSLAQTENKDCCTIISNNILIFMDICVILPSINIRRRQIMERAKGLLGFADYVVSKNRGPATFLDGVDDMIEWGRIEKLLKRELGITDEVKAGAKSYPVIQMFKVLLLQQWYGLSDKDTEFCLSDRLSFMRFVGFSLEESVPDHTTICRFRNAVVAKDLLELLLNDVNTQMEKQGKLVKKGIAVDASIISSAARPRKVVVVDNVVTDRKEAETTPTIEPQETVVYSHDSDAAWTKKGKESLVSQVLSKKSI
jgi:IS5 family transposase